MRTELIPSEHWRAALPIYLAWLGAAGQPNTTQKLRSYHLRRFATSTKLEPFDVGFENLIDWLDAGDWSKATRRSYRTSFRSFYRWAKHTGRVRKNPAKKLPTIPVPPGIPRPADEASVAAGLRGKNARETLMVRLAAQAGLRCREIALVRTQDVIRGADGYYLRVHGKGDKDRDVPLMDSLALEILSLPEGWAFPGQIDGHLSPGHVSKLVSRALPQGVTAHPLRHRFASIAYAGTGGDIRAVQELLGHASVATTQVYTKIPDGKLRQGVLAAA
jgi:integrase/recombinase XerC